MPGSCGPSGRVEAARAPPGERGAEELRCTTTSGKLEFCGFAAQRLRAETVRSPHRRGQRGRSSP